MNIAILSGKGGTGKTTIATNLVEILQANYIDCDVEEPNGYIFLKPENNEIEKVLVENPVIDMKKCNLCGECTKICQFNALFNTKKEVIVFEKMCHSCKACAIGCKTGAISFRQREIGIIEKGKKNGLICMKGVLDIGEPMAVPVIKKLLEATPSGLNLLDCSPGTSCNAVNTLRHAQGALLVTEPSAFGLHDLKMAITLVRSFGLPIGVIINKWDERGAILMEEYLKAEGIIVLGNIPYNREAAEVYSRGEMICKIPSYQGAFLSIAENGREVFGWN